MGVEMENCRCLAMRKVDERCLEEREELVAQKL